MIHKAKKSLGQNFLKSQSVLRKIVETGEIKKGEVVLEIGPGKGALTEKLLEAGARVVAVEKDDNLFAYLQEKFKIHTNTGALILVHGDILEFNSSAYGLAPSAYKLIANIPYNITGAILKKFLAGTNQPSEMVLLVQKEVAGRIIATNQKESLLSMSVKVYGKPKMVIKVPARYFSPAPKVDSAVISIKNISKRFFTDNQIAENRFWEVLHAGFAHKRKKLSGNLKKLNNFHLPENLKNKRAEEMTLADWLLCIKN